jgi:hypothetical protein
VTDAIVEVSYYLEVEVEVDLEVDDVSLPWTTNPKKIQFFCKINSRTVKASFSKINSWTVTLHKKFLVNYKKIQF